jgi:hypothetical protein
MRIAHIVLPGASEYERKSQRADRDALSEKHELVEDVKDAQLAHVYATGTLPGAPFVKFPVPYVASADMRRARWSLRKPRAPEFVVSPVGEKAVPEVVEEGYWSLAPARSPRMRGEGGVVGSFHRDSTRNMVEQTLARIQRFRTDVTWKVFDRVPTPEDLAGVDVWVDPAVSDDDFDGFVAEAFVVDLPVVAARTPINSLRLEQGRTGMLVPPRDPNEMTHAILAALFKREVADSKRQAAKQTVSKFRARQRLRILAHLYESLIS